MQQIGQWAEPLGQAQLAPRPEAPTYRQLPDPARPTIRLEPAGYAPVPRPRSRRRKNGFRYARIALRTIVLATAACGGLVFASMTDGGRHARDLRLAMPELETLARAAGLGLDQVSVSGQRFTPDADVFDALQLDRNQLLLGFDSAAARRRIESLPWVLSAELTRVLPGRLEIAIRERQAYATWDRGPDEVMVDRTGRILQRIPKGSVQGLPHVKGEDAGPEAPGLMTLIARYPAITASFAGAERVGGRRWRVSLTNGSEIELPADGEALVLDRLAAQGELLEIAQGSPRIVDLRASGRIAVRPAPVAARRVAGVGGLP